MIEPLPKMAMRLPGNCLSLRTSDARSPIQELSVAPIASAKGPRQDEFRKAIHALGSGRFTSDGGRGS